MTCWETSSLRVKFEFEPTLCSMIVDAFSSRTGLGKGRKTPKLTWEQEIEEQNEGSFYQAAVVFGLAKNR